MGQYCHERVLEVVHCTDLAARVGLINTGTRRYLDAYEGVFLKGPTLMTLE